MSYDEEIKQKRVDASLAKRRAIKDLDEALTEYGLMEDSEWNFMQLLALEVEAYYTTKDERINSSDLVRKMGQHAEKKYGEEYPDLIPKIKAALPSHQRVVEWRKKKNWQVAVWDKCKETGLFTPEKRSNVIMSMYMKAVEKQDTQAAKLYLTISGDYSEKVDVAKDKVADIFREINEKLHNKN